MSVDWTAPPYRVGGLVRLVLEGEDPATIPAAVQRQRIAEYSEQARKGARTDWSDSLVLAARVFAMSDVHR